MVMKSQPNNNSLEVFQFTCARTAGPVRELSAVAGDWIENGAVREATDRPGAADFIGALAGLPVVLSAATFRAVAVRGHIESIVREDYPCEDLPLFMQLLESGPIARHPRPALIYSTADGTVSRPRDIAKARTYHERVIAMRLSLIGRHSLDRSEEHTSELQSPR